MFKNYMNTTLRNLTRNKFYSIINILGLAVGLACTILILIYVHYELSFDAFHKDSDRIFRFLQLEDKENSVYLYSSPELLARVLKENIPEVEHATRIMDSWADYAILSYDDNKFYQHGMFADEEFFQIFSFPLVTGNSATLATANNIILTQSVASKLFGNENPIGKVIHYKEKYMEYDFTVSGIMEDIPTNSHLQFDYLISVQTLVEEKRYEYMIDNWDVHNFITYVKLNTDCPKNLAENKILSCIQNILPDLEFEEGALSLQPLNEIHLRSNIEGELSTNNQIRYVYLFLSIAIIVLLVASFNYMNLTTARSSRRSREIGVRKILGANRKQLFKQFIGESIIFSFIALCISLIIVECTFSKFGSIIGVELPRNYLANNQIILIIFCTTLILGLISGLYPAIIFSKYRPDNIVRSFITPTKKKVLLRNILIITQFTISVILMISTVIVFKQLNYIHSSNLGYDREHIILIPVREKETHRKTQIIKDELLRLPNIEKVSITAALPMDIRSFISTKFINESGDAESMSFNFDYTDENFIPIFNLELATGNNFNIESSNVSRSVLVNETFVKKTNWKNPIGKTIKWFEGDLTVVGVLKDFHFDTFHHEIEPMMLKYEPAGNIAIRYTSSDLRNTLASIKKVFEENTQGQPFDYYFMDDAFDSLYKKEQRLAEIFTIFAIIAILISCSGLVGLVVFMVQNRSKEIGIRKVLGAEVRHINLLLSKEFMKLIFIANLIACPVAYFTMKHWLRGFSYQTRITIWIFLLVGMSSFIIALVMVGFQIHKAAYTNPAQVIKYE
jgi:putative ABC transport system permease protein